MSPESSGSMEKLASQEQFAELKRLVSVLIADSELKQSSQGGRVDAYFSKEFQLNNYTKIEVIDTLKAATGPHLAIVYDYGEGDYEIGKLIVIENEGDHVKGTVAWDKNAPPNEFMARQMPEWQELQDFADRSNAADQPLRQDEADQQVSILSALIEGAAYKQEDIKFKEAEPKNAASLHARLQTFLDKHGVEGWPAREDEDEPRRPVGRNMQAKVWGPRGWNSVNVEEEIDDYAQHLFERDITPTESKLIRVDFDSMENFLISPEAVAKFASSRLELEQMQDFEMEWLFEDLEGLFETSG